MEDRGAVSMQRGGWESKGFWQGEKIKYGKEHDDERSPGKVKSMEKVAEKRKREKRKKYRGKKNQGRHV
jgi:hypothetical protein